MRCQFSVVAHFYELQNETIYLQITENKPSYINVFSLVILMWQIHKTINVPLCDRFNAHFNSGFQENSAHSKHTHSLRAENSISNNTVNLCPFLGVNQEKCLNIDLICILSLHRLINFYGAACESVFKAKQHG